MEMEGHSIIVGCGAFREKDFGRAGRGKSEDGSAIHRVRFRKTLPAHTVPVDFRFEAKFPIVGRKTMLLNAARLATPGNDTDWILLAMQDASVGK